MSKRVIALRLGAALVAVAALVLFAYENASQSVDLSLGVFTLRGLSLPVVLYAAVVIGMAVMLLAGLRSDLRTHDALKHYDKIASDVLRSIDGREGSSEEAGSAKEARDKV
ncbi:MAG: hypothetical protein JSU87_07745 [Gemmatimonadota bacterium]|nr:MAG: hypothetical protein JSU87_07745 [Gemmatimonadota bacterium]